jgi:peptide/nickel transport system substrate-binding protein
MLFFAEGMTMSQDLTRFLAGSSLSRRELLEKLAALGVAAPALGLLGGSALSTRSARAQGTVQPGGTLRYGFWQPISNLDPQVGGLQIEALINQGIQDRLVWKKPGDPTYYPGLAESWEAAADFTSYTLKLRTDVTFHDGTPFNADAVKFTFDRIVDPATKSGGALVALGPYDSSEVIDDATIKVNFKEPNGSFLNMCTTVWLSPQSPAAIQQYGQDYQDHLTGCGPFKMTEYVHDDHVTLEKNPDYAWGPSIFNHTGAPILDSIVFRLMPEDATRLAALKSGDVDLIDRVAPEDLASLSSDSAYKTFSGETGGAPWILQLNNQKAPTDELAVRQAMMKAFDQAAIVDLLFSGTLAPSYNYLEPTMVGYDETTKDLFAVDVDGAKKLLEDAGWTGDGTRSKDGNPLKVDLYIVANFGMDDMSAAFQSQMQEIGMEVEIKSAEAASTFAAINAGEAGASWVFYWWADPSGPYSAFFSTAHIGSGNGALYSNPTVDQQLADALATGDDTKRADLYNQVCRTLIAEAVSLPAFQKRLVLASTAKVDLDSLHTNAEGYPNFYDVGFLA